MLLYSLGSQKSHSFFFLCISFVLFLVCFASPFLPCVCIVSSLTSYFILKDLYLCHVFFTPCLCCFSTSSDCLSCLNWFHLSFLNIVVCSFIISLCLFVSSVYCKCLYFTHFCFFPPLIWSGFRSKAKTLKVSSWVFSVTRVIRFLKLNRSRANYIWDERSKQQTIQSPGK